MIAPLTPVANACRQACGELTHARPWLAFQPLDWSMSAAAGYAGKIQPLFRTQQAKGK